MTLDIDDQCTNYDYSTQLNISKKIDSIVFSYLVFSDSDIYYLSQFPINLSL